MGANTTSLRSQTTVPVLHLSSTIRFGASSKGWKLEIKLKERALVSPSSKKSSRVEADGYGLSRSLALEPPSALHGLNSPKCVLSHDSFVWIVNPPLQHLQL